MGELAGKVAFVTGGARGQGRSHAIRLAQEGADIITVDICRQIDSVGYPMAMADDLIETVHQVEALGRRIVAHEADVRDAGSVKAALDDGVAQLGRLDIVCANAGIVNFCPVDEMTDEVWDDMIDVNLSGVFKTARAAIPHLKKNENGGAIVLTSSVGGIKAMANLAHYVSAKHGVVGLMKTLALELAPFSIRVNSVHPTAVNTDMIQNQQSHDQLRPDLAAGNAIANDVDEASGGLNLLPIRWVEPVDISNAILWLVSDAARYVTGVQLPIDAGALIK